MPLTERKPVQVVGRQAGRVQNSGTITARMVDDQQFGRFLLGFLDLLLGFVEGGDVELAGEHDLGGHGVAPMTRIAVSARSRACCKALMSASSLSATVSPEGCLTEPTTFTSRPNP
jgi:hypothetical protein